MTGVEVAVTSVEGLARLRAAARAPLAVHVKARHRHGAVGDERRRRAAGSASSWPPDRPGCAGRPDEPPGLGRRRRRVHTAASSSGSPSWRRCSRPARATSQTAPPRSPSRGRLGRRPLRHRRLRPLAVPGRPGPARASPGAPIRELRRPGEAARSPATAPATDAGWWSIARPGSGSPRPGTPTACRACCPGKMDVLVRGRRRRVAATISMDQLTFVIGERCDVELGDAVRPDRRGGRASGSALRSGRACRTRSATRS